MVMLKVGETRKSVEKRASREIIILELVVCANRAGGLNSIQLELLLLFHSGTVQRTKITTKSLLDQEKINRQ